MILLFCTGWILLLVGLMALAHRAGRRRAFDQHVAETMSMVRNKPSHRETPPEDDPLWMQWAWREGKQ